MPHEAPIAAAHINALRHAVGRINGPAGEIKQRKDTWERGRRGAGSRLNRLLKLKEGAAEVLRVVAVSEPDTEKGVPAGREGAPNTCEGQLTCGSDGLTARKDEQGK